MSGICTVLIMQNTCKRHNLFAVTAVKPESYTEVIWRLWTSGPLSGTQSNVIDVLHQRTPVMSHRQVHTACCIDAARDCVALQHHELSVETHPWLTTDPCNTVDVHCKYINSFFRVVTTLKRPFFRQRVLFNVWNVLTLIEQI